MHQRTGRATGLNGRGLRELVDSLGLQYRTVGDLAYSVMRQGILNGLLVPGEKLRQEELAQAMGISREPVRNALMQLASDGLVVTHPHRGAAVSSLSIARIQEIYDIRIVLESYAVRRGIAAMNSERLAKLERLADQFDRARRSQHSVRLRTAFYEELYDAETNPLLVDLIDRLRSDVGRYWVRRRELFEREHSHRPLVEYARTGGGDAAARWIADHLRRVAAELLSTLESESAQGAEPSASTASKSGARSCAAAGSQARSSRPASGR